MKRKIIPTIISLLICGIMTVGCTNSATTNSSQTNMETNTDKETDVTNNDTLNSDMFIENLKTSYYVQEGSFKNMDTIELASQKQLISCFGNNAGSSYLVPFLPPAPNQDPAAGIQTEIYQWPDEEPSEYYDPSNTDNYPANPYFSPVGWSYKLAEDEAVVLIGELPPECKYYSFINYIFFTQVKEGKDYSNEKGFFQIGNENIGFYHPVFGSLSAPINQTNIKSANGEIFGSKFALVITGDQNTYAKIKDALITAGISENIINESPIPSASLNMGLEKGKDTFTTLMRISQPENAEDYQTYIDSLSDTMQVYRITPKDDSETSAPYTLADLRERGTGVHEISLLPEAPQALDEIRSNLIEQYSDEYTYEEFSPDIAVPEGMTAYLNDINAQGDNRDAAYTMTANFTLNSDEDFIIVYGINHVKTNKASYSNTVLYSRPMLNGVVSVYDSSYEGSAEQYLDDSFENRDSYYVYKLARTEMDDYTAVIPYSEGNPQGEYYGVDNGDILLLAYRSYLEPETGVGPSYYEIVYDRAIVFHKK